MTELLVISAGTGSPSSSRLLGERIAEATVAALADGGTPVSVSHLELRTIAVELAQQLTTRLPGAKLRAAFDQVRSASGVIVVSPVMNGSFSGLFKLFF
ncbi:MAG: NAD(P)H-dependent oxidoreductase, partial [Propionicimonas sp.]